MHNELLTITGVGPKVADCVALFSLDQLQCIPVDTHVFQIAKRFIKLNSVNSKARNEVADLFVGAFGELAGWAHCIFFAGELAPFRGSVKRSREFDTIQIKGADDDEEGNVPEIEVEAHSDKDRAMSRPKKKKRT